MPVRGWIGVARYGLPGVLLGVMLMGGTGGGQGPSRLAKAENLPGGERPRPAMGPGGEMSGTIAFTSTISGAAQLLYLIDTRTQAFAIYRVDPSNTKGAVKLEATRQYHWDLKLTEYNNQPLEVAAIESMVKTLRQPSR